MDNRGFEREKSNDMTEQVFQGDIGDVTRDEGIHDGFDVSGIGEKVGGLAFDGGLAEKQGEIPIGMPPNVEADSTAMNDVDELRNIGKDGVLDDGELAKVKEIEMDSADDPAGLSAKIGKISEWFRGGNYGN